MKYLAPYVFHVAISNRRLLALDDQGDMGNSRITFAYRTSDTGESKTITLSVEAFLQRFLQHVLPKGLVKVRYYGCFAPGCRKRLAALRQQLQPDPPTSANLSQVALVPGQQEETPHAATQMPELRYADAPPENLPRPPPINPHSYPSDALRHDIIPCPSPCATRLCHAILRVHCPHWPSF